ncbi:MAG: DASS family sodium-coupled anion symporter [Gammaproteobacteria bacterium]
MRVQIGLWLGPVLFLLVLLAPTPADMSQSAQAVAAVVVLMATWWISEAIPIAATALVPIVLFPLLGVTSASEVTGAYGHHLIFLFLGGFLLAATIQRWELHRRLALHTISLIGNSPQHILLGFMLASAGLSMWISNTATVMMMIPIATAVAAQYTAREEGAVAAGKAGFATALMLGIAYAASIGGTATLIGTPPNAIFAGMVEQLYGIRIGFAQWMLFALPFALLFLFIAWWYLSRYVYANEPLVMVTEDNSVQAELQGLRSMTREEKLVLIVFGGVALCWLLRGLLSGPLADRVEDSTIAILGALLLFILPASGGRRLLDWQTALQIPWGVLILFGGGFALASGFQQTGLSVWLGERLLVFDQANVFWLIVLVGVLVKFLTEITSNTATTALLIPVMAAFAEAAGVQPVILMVVVAMSASLAFMLPVATPPNAIIFATPYITIPKMVRAGVWLNLLAIPALSLCVYFWLPLVWKLPLYLP